MTARNAETVSRSWRSGPLGVPGFQLLTLGQFTSTIGDCCHAIALPWLVLSGHDSVDFLGAVLACYGVSRAVFTVPSGSLADRFGSRRVMLASDAARSALAAVLAVLAAAHVSSLAALAPVAAMLGACSALFLPASMTLMPSLVDTARLASANALYAGFIQVGTTIGPMIGGVLVAAVGPAPAFAADSVSYLVSAVCLARTGHATGPWLTADTVSDPVARNAWPLLTLLRRERVLRVALAVSFTANLALTGIIEVTLPVLARARYGANGFGALLACIAVMSVLGALGVARAGERFARATLIAGAFQVAAAAIALAPFFGGLPGLTAGLAVLGLAFGFDTAVWATLVQRWAPPELLARVWGVLVLAPVAAFPLSTLLAGVLTRCLGPAPVFPISGALLALAYLFGLSQREFRELGARRLEPRPKRARRFFDIRLPPTSSWAWNRARPRRGRKAMAHISYVDPATVKDPELGEIMERARAFGTPRPESQAIRLHNPPVMKAFNNAWETFFRQGVTDHSIKELCRLYIAKSVECQYCGGQRSVQAMAQGTTESQVDDILNFETSDRFDARERAALAWAMAIAWDPDLADDALWDRLHEHFTEPQLIELGHFIALTLGQQRFLRTVGVRHGEVLADTDAGLAPAEAARLRDALR